MDNKFRTSSISLSENCQTNYCDKAYSHKLLMTVVVYNLVILKYSVFIFLDLKQMETVYFQLFELLCVEITGMLMI